MPTLKQIDCSIELGPKNIKLPEYGTLIRDGYIETFIAVPDASIPFTIHIKTQGYIYSGLAFFVFIDGEYQCNRNRIELKTPGRGIVAKDYQTEFRLRQKEEKTADGSFLAREWTFEKLDSVKADKASNTRKKQYVENVGTIEVVVLRCQSDEEVPPPRLMPTQVREVQATPKKTKKQERKQKAKEPSVHEPVSEFGGVFGLFDGAYDNGDFDGPGEDQARDPGNDQPPQTTQGVEWNSIMGEYRPALQRVDPDRLEPGSQGPQQTESNPEYQRFSDQHAPEDLHARASAEQPGEQPEASQSTARRAVSFEIGADEETTPPRISEDSDPNELVVRFRNVLKEQSPYTNDEAGVLHFREELDVYKTQLRRFKNHNPDAYAEKFLRFTSVQQLEASLESMRLQLGLVPESKAEPAAEPAEGGSMTRGDSQVLTDGASDWDNLAQPVPNKGGWEEIGQGNANFGAQTQRRTFARGPQPYNQPPIRFYKNENGDLIPIGGPPGNQGYHPTPRGVPVVNWVATGHNQQPNVQFAPNGQFQRQGAGPQFGYGEGGMNHGGYKQQNWFDNGGPWVNHLADLKKDPMNGDVWTPSERAMGENYVDSRYKDDGEWDRKCEEWKKEREEKGIAGDPTINNPKFQKKAAEDERKMSDRKKSDKKTNSSHGWGAGDGDANQQGWADGGWDNKNAANSATAAWDDTGKKSSGRGNSGNQANGWDDTSKQAGHLDKAASPWTKNADGGNNHGWGNADSKKSSHRKSDKNNGAADGWMNDNNNAGIWSNNKGDSAPGGWNGQDNNDDAANGWASKANDNAAGWGGGNDNNTRSNRSKSDRNQNGNWDNQSQSRSRSASQVEWSANGQQDNRPPRRTREDVNSKAHIKPYFNDWNKPPADSDSTTYRMRDTPRDAYKYPALPHPAVPSNAPKDKSHGVQAGKGADYSHKCRRPVYVDSMEQPYAVFTFKYRSRKVVESILNVKVDQVDFRKIQEQMEYEKLLQNPKERLAREVARLRMGQGRQPSSHRSPSNKGHSDRDWNLDGHNGGATDGEQRIQPAQEVWKPDNGSGRKVESPNNLGGWGSYEKPAAPASKTRGNENEQNRPGKAGMAWDGNFGPISPPRSIKTTASSLFW